MSLAPAPMTQRSWYVTQAKAGTRPAPLPPIPTLLTMFEVVANGPRVSRYRDRIADLDRAKASSLERTKGAALGFGLQGGVEYGLDLLPARAGFAPPAGSDLPQTLQTLLRKAL